MENTKVYRDINGNVLRDGDIVEYQMPFGGYTWIGYWKTNTVYTDKGYKYKEKGAINIKKVFIKPHKFKPLKQLLQALLDAGYLPNAYDAWSDTETLFQKSWIQLAGQEIPAGLLEEMESCFPFVIDNN